MAKNYEIMDREQSPTAHEFIEGLIAEMANRRGPVSIEAFGFGPDGRTHRLVLRVEVVEAQCLDDVTKH